MRVKKGIYWIDLLALLGEIASNSTFNFIIKHSSKTQTALSVHLSRCPVVIHTWSSEVAILHAFVGFSLLVLLTLITILRLAAIVRWKISARGRALGDQFDFLTTFGRERQRPKWWEVLVGKSILKSHLPWVSRQYFFKRRNVYYWRYCHSGESLSFSDIVEVSLHSFSCLLSLVSQFSLLFWDQYGSLYLSLSRMSEPWMYLSISEQNLRSGT